MLKFFKRKLKKILGNIYKHYFCTVSEVAEAIYLLCISIRNFLVLEVTYCELGGQNFAYFGPTSLRNDSRLRT